MKTKTLALSSVSTQPMKSVIARQDADKFREEVLRRLEHLAQNPPKKRRLRPREARPSASGATTKFFRDGKLIKARVNPTTGQIEILHATKGWRRLPKNHLPQGWVLPEK
jgi:hypothetical protein